LSFIEKNELPGIYIGEQIFKNLFLRILNISYFGMVVGIELTSNKKLLRRV